MSPRSRQADEDAIAIATSRDAAGIPVHRGWAPLGTRHRWMEPFVMVLLAGGAAHGYAIVGELAQLGITNGSVDVGQVYRTLRDLEEAGLVTSTWATGTGAARRDYELTDAGLGGARRVGGRHEGAQAPAGRVRRPVPGVGSHSQAGREGHEQGLERLRIAWSRPAASASFSSSSRCRSSTPR